MAVVGKPRLSACARWLCCLLGASWLGAVAAGITPQLRGGALRGRACPRCALSTRMNLSCRVGQRP